jgi:hypothetical protein
MNLSSTTWLTHFLPYVRNCSVCSATGTSALFIVPVSCINSDVFFRMEHHLDKDVYFFQYFIREQNAMLISLLNMY